jgi:hypothetical protein
VNQQIPRGIGPWKSALRKEREAWAPFYRGGELKSRPLSCHGSISVASERRLRRSGRMSCIAIPDALVQGLEVRQASHIPRAHLGRCLCAENLLPAARIPVVIYVLAFSLIHTPYLCFLSWLRYLGELDERDISVPFPGPVW